MSPDPIIIFVCEHGAAKSILAAAYFNHLAHQRGLRLRAIARGTNPDPELSEQTVQGMSRDGVSPTESVPHKLSLEDIQGAQGMVSFCELPAEHAKHGIVELWKDVPPVSENYEKARDAILERLNQYLDNIRSSR